MKIQDLLNCSSKWVKNGLSVDKNNKSVNPRSSAAIKWCLIGALEKCYPKFDDRFAASSKVINALSHFNYSLHLPIFNDDPKTTFQMLKKVIKKANV